MMIVEDLTLTLKKKYKLPQDIDGTVWCYNPKCSLKSKFFLSKKNQYTDEFEIYCVCSNICSMALNKRKRVVRKSKRIANKK